MLLYKNHRFHYEGVSFAIPEGFYLDTSYDNIHQNTLNLWSEGKNLYICISVQKETQGTYHELSLVLRNLEDIFITNPIAPVSLGGLSGYVATYMIDPKHYWEAHLHISGEANNQTELLLLIRSKESPFEEESLCALINKICIQYSPC